MNQKLETLFIPAANPDSRRLMVVMHGLAVLHRYVFAYDAVGNRISEQINATVATETANVVNQVTSRTSGGSVRVAGFISTT
jgi:hypothetical protein